MKFNFFKKIWGKKEKKEKEDTNLETTVKDTKQEKPIEIKIETGESFKILPLLTEKALSLSKKENKYSFLVESKMNKAMLKKAIEKMFNVEVMEIKTMNYKKRVRGLTKIKSIRPKFKKAIVELKEGQKISIFE
jgi:large subunit ribosomal protein L23